jgi:hypothetical protein
MTWGGILAHVKQVEECNEGPARRQIGSAIEDGALQARWADERSPIHTPDDVPPRDADYWLECESDPNDPDSVREPPPYDPSLVSNRRAKQLDKWRRFRAPRFPRHQVLRLWPESRGSAATEANAIAFLADRLQANRNMRRDDAWTACKTKFPKLSERGFLSRVWPRARKRARLEPAARAGRKPTRKIENV